MSVTPHKPRTSLQITLSVWKALFLREAVSKTTARRLGWFWMIAEPVFMIAIMAVIRAAAFGDSQHIGGAEFIPWLVVGLLGFFLFQESLLGSLVSVASNRGLFAYRQVKPVDAVLVRCFFVFAMRTFIFLLFLLASLLVSIDLIASHPLVALAAWGSLWALGLGCALVSSVLACLVAEYAIVIRLLTLPLMITSGALIPLNFIPHDVLTYLMWSPLVHGVEFLRIGFFEDYKPVYGTSMLYLWSWNIGLISLGLVLHIHYSMKLKRQ